MKRLLVLAVLCIANFAYAEGLKLERVDIAGAVHNRTVRDNGTPKTPGALGQGSLKFTLSNSVYFGSWGANPTNSDPKNNPGKEVDVYAGLSIVSENFKWFGEIARYNLYPVGDRNSSDVSSVKGGISPKTPWVYRDGSTLNWYTTFEVLHSSGLKLNNIVQLYAGLRSMIPIRNGWSYNQVFQVGRQPTFSPTLTSGWIGYYQGNLEYALNKNTSVGLEIRRYQPLFGSLDGGRKNENVGGLTFKTFF